MSREAIFYVFMDLNLRLPSNLDLAGLPLEPYAAVSHPALVGPSAVSLTPSAISRPPWPQPNSRMTPDAPADIVEPSGSKHVLSANAVPFSPSSANGQPAAPSSPSLLDMEQQRKQELLARKAVQASRKFKVAPGASAAGPSIQVTVSHTAEVHKKSPSVPTEAVEDFLNSIGSVEVHSLVTPQCRSPDTMDTDNLPSSIPPEGEIRSSSAVPPLLSPSSNPQPTSKLPDGLSRTTSELSVSMDLDGPKSGSSTPSARQSDSSGAGFSSRRSLKRPVASDFVDMEPNPSRPRHHSNGHNGFHHRTGPQKKASFAGVSGIRRMVINLSDSEEDGEDQPIDVKPRVSPSNWRFPLRRSPSRPVTPAQLQEKELELEIRKMKELIALREQNRLKKQAAVRYVAIPALPLFDLLPGFWLLHSFYFGGCQTGRR